MTGGEILQIKNTPANARLLHTEEEVVRFAKEA